jgi:VWFA-related protein
VRDDIAKMLWNLPQTVDRIEILALGDELKTVHSFSPFTHALRSAILEFDWQPAAMPQANRQMWTLKTLSNIAHDMSKVRGEKNLLWIGGISRAESGGGEPGGRGGFSLARSGGGRSGGGGAPTPDYYQDMARVMQELSAARVMFYPVIPSMVKPFELDDFAQLTGGKVYWEDKDLAGLLRDAIDDSREGYMLTYVPNNYQKDGSAHEVKLKIARKGIELRYRPAYMADPPAQ